MLGVLLVHLDLAQRDHPKPRAQLKDLRVQVRFEAGFPVLFRVFQHEPIMIRFPFAIHDVPVALTQLQEQLVSRVHCACH